MEDTDILVNTAQLILAEEEAQANLVQAVQGTARPEAGVAMFLMMMIQAIHDMLSNAGIEVASDTWASPDGVIDQLLPEITDILVSAGIEVGPDFGEGVVSALLERAKGAAQAEEQAAQGPAPQAAPQPGGGLLDAVGGMA